MNKTEYVYLIRAREFDSQNLPAYKIGRSSRDASKRMVEYPADSRLFEISHVYNSKLVELEIIRHFSAAFFNDHRFGKETFIGDVRVMKRMIHNIAEIENDKYEQKQNLAKIKQFWLDFEEKRKNESKPIVEDLFVLPEIGTDSLTNILDLMENPDQEKTTHVDAPNNMTATADNNSIINHVVVNNVDNSVNVVSTDTNEGDAFMDHLWSNVPSWYIVGAVVPYDDLYNIYKEFTKNTGSLDKRRFTIKYYDKIFVKAGRTQNSKGKFIQMIRLLDISDA